MFLLSAQAGAALCQMFALNMYTDTITGHTAGCVTCCLRITTL